MTSVVWPRRARGLVAVAVLFASSPLYAAVAGPPAPATAVNEERLSASASTAATTRSPRTRADGTLRGWGLDATLVGVGQIGDIVSTELALRRPGTREANPLLGNRAVRVSAKLALASGAAYACRELRQHGRTHQARLLAITVFAVGAIAAAHNVSIAVGR